MPVGGGGGRTQADVVVVGSGMGGGTTALALARRGVDVLIVERGARLPREEENWSPRAVFIERRYKPAERWRDGAGRAFAPGVHYVVGGNTKVYGASLPRFRERDFAAVEHLEGTSPAWPFGYRDLEPYYAEAERLYGVHGTAGADPTEPWRSGPFPYPALPHEPYVADLAGRLRDHGVHPSPTAMAVDRRPGGLCIRCATCDGFPCRLDAKADAETRGVDPAIATGHGRLLTGTRVRRIVTDPTGRRVHHLVATGPDGTVTITGGKFVLSAGAVNSAALLLASADEKNPSGLSNSSGQVGRNSTTKLTNSEHGTDRALRAFEASLAKLGLDEVDLFLIHWPVPARDLYVQTWQTLDKIRAEGRARSIGVSNFTREHLSRLLRETGVVPAVNQVELHPRFPQQALRAYHAEHGILTEAWAPIGQGQGLLEDKTIVQLAARKGRSPAQIVLRTCNSGTSPSRSP